jgi:hypothetical protein
MTSDALLEMFRRDTMDIRRPYLWSDEEIYAFENDAYYMFARLTGGIPDFSTSAVCLVTATVNVSTSALHPKILRIRKAHLEADGRAVHVINAQDTDGLNDEDYGLLRRLSSVVNIPGPVRYMIIGQEQDKVQWVNLPDATTQVRLLVERLPLTTIDGPDQTFDGVKDHHVLHLLKWMRHLAYNKQDAEVYDPSKSASEAAAFMGYCDLARREKEVAKHKVRVVRYGGI